MILINILSYHTVNIAGLLWWPRFILSYDKLNGFYFWEKIDRNFTNICGKKLIINLEIKNKFPIKKNRFPNNKFISN